MSIPENIRYLCKKHKTSIPRLEKQLGLGNGAIYKWEKSSPTVDKLQQVADHFNVSLDFLTNGFDRELTRIIWSLSNEVPNEHGSQLYFCDEVLKVLNDELEPLKKEYWDVPFDEFHKPYGIIGLLHNFPVSNEFKEDLLNVLIRVKQRTEPYEATTIAAHNTGADEDWTEDELEDIKKFKEFVKMKRNKQ